MKTPLLLALLFLYSAVPAFAEDIWLYPPTKGNAELGPAKAWLEGRGWKVNDPREHKAPLTPPLKLGRGVWYQSVVDPSTKNTFIPHKAPWKPVAKPIDLDVISVIAPEKKVEHVSIVTDDLEFQALWEKLAALEAELQTLEAAPAK